MNAKTPVIGRGGRWLRLALAWIVLPGWTLIPGASSATANEARHPGDELTTLLALLAGEVHGVFTPVEGRLLAWRLALSPAAGAAAGGLRTGEVVVAGPDLTLRVALGFDPLLGRMSWRVVEGRLDLGAWWPALGTRPELATTLAGLSATGVVTITGQGTWVAGAATGQLRAELTNGTVRNDVEGWSLEGVTLRAGGDAAALQNGVVPMEVTVRTINSARFGARNLSVRAKVRDFDNLAVESTRIEIAGGEVTVEPFTVSLAEPAVSATVVMRRVGLQDLIVFVPTAVSEARGRINGKMRLDWHPKDGVQVGAGGLSLEESEPTTLRLVSTPGFLTEQVPVRFILLPGWLGPLARWFSLGNPSYKTLSDIERGKLGLRVEALDVRLTPEGDERGRSASVFIRARPEQPGSVVKEVTFEINVSGPLAAVLRMGMQQEFSVKSR